MTKPKVFVQIPCYNEEKTLPLVLETIPKEIPGVDLEILVIDDGSSDKTIEIAKKYGVKHFVIFARNMGLARAFQEGVNYALGHGADIVVNTDGDNQYPQGRIPDLIQPILDGEADIVIADRQTSKIAHFSPLKKLLQRFGSYIVNQAAGTNLPDAASGFRAYSKKSLLRLNVVTKFSYCMETIIQAGNKNLAIVSLPVTTNKKTRESRLFKSMRQHVFKSMQAIVRSYIMFKPYGAFMFLGTLFLIVGLIPFVRYFYLVISNTQGDHIQSLLLGSVLLVGAFLSYALAVISDLIRTNRILIEDTLERVKKIQYDKK
ncbi:glycosyl transferase, family 2 [candidate division TM7 genomosp. GTL1]|nr:glycosyl transferase, family 2 [candidate division TM7 genomosp. GTL1]